VSEACSYFIIDTAFHYLGCIFERYFVKVFAFSMYFEAEHLGRECLLCFFEGHKEWVLSSIYLARFVS